MSASFAFDQLPPGPRVGGAVPGGLSPEDVGRAMEGAHAQGFHEGHAAGLAEAQARVTAAEQALQAAVTALHGEREVLADRVERAAVTLALQIAEQALRAAVAADPQRVMDAVEGALRGLVERERVTILVHPDDLDAVRAGVDPLMGELGGVGHWEVQAERRVTRGGAVVRTADGEVDATLETKIARAREVLDDELTAR